MDTVDVLVIGGGLTGCAAAFHLAGAGASVLVVEQGDLNAGASGQNAGSLHFQLERRFLVHGAATAEHAARIVALNRLAIDDWSGVEDLLGCDVGVHMAGGLMVAENAEQTKILERKCALEKRWGLDTVLLDGASARRIAPYLAHSVCGAAFLDREGSADPRLATLAFAAAALERGTRLLSRTRLSALDRIAGRFHADLVQGGVRLGLSARSVVVAAGAWTAAVGTKINVHLPIFPVGLTMNVTERTEAFLPHLLQHVAKPLSIKQDGRGNILIGGGWPSRLQSEEAGGFSLRRRPVLTETSFRENLRAAAEAIPRLRSANLIRTWTGMTALTPDHLPLAGEVGCMPGLFVAAGGSGFTLGPTIARLLSNVVGGGQADELEMFAPVRYDHLNRFMA